MTLRENISATESHIEQQDSELAALADTVNSSQNRLNSLRSLLDERLAAVRPTDTDIDTYVVQLLTSIGQKQVSGDGDVSLDELIKKALAGMKTD